MVASSCMPPHATPPQPPQSLRGSAPLSPSRHHDQVGRTSTSAGGRTMHAYDARVRDHRNRGGTPHLPADPSSLSSLPLASTSSIPCAHAHGTAWYACCSSPPAAAPPVGHPPPPPSCSGSALGMLPTAAPPPWCRLPAMRCIISPKVCIVGGGRESFVRLLACSS